MTNMLLPKPIFFHSKLNIKIYLLLQIKDGSQIDFFTTGVKLTSWVRVCF